jgi:response regulator RpfG family c-di-GMP phosphodiesterase
MKRILVVDDEVQINKALLRMFQDTDYEVITADNGKDALELIETTNIDMVISDMRMPMLDGYELLSIVKDKYPRIIRIILSGYTDEKPMFRALLHNIAKLYVFKPWNNNDFLKNISKLFSDDLILNSTVLTNKIKELGCTSNMSDNCQNMITRIEEEDMDGLVVELEKDPDISDLLMQVAKQAVYGVMPNKIKQASIYIGLHNLKSFIHFACIISSSDNSCPGKLDHLIKHAYYTNRIFLFLYETFLHKQPPDATMFAGLLHNVGLMLLAKSKQQNDSLTDLDYEEYVTLEQGEHEISHQEIGAHFLDVWDLPFPMYEVAQYHHRPLDPCIVHQELVCCVHIAQAYAWKALRKTDHADVSPEVFDHIEVSPEDFEKRLARYMK